MYFLRIKACFLAGKGHYNFEVCIVERLSSKYQQRNLQYLWLVS